jgi:hypothetical protein
MGTWHREALQEQHLLQVEAASLCLRTCHSSSNSSGNSSSSKSSQVWFLRPLLHVWEPPHTHKGSPLQQAVVQVAILLPHRPQGDLPALFRKHRCHLHPPNSPQQHQQREQQWPQHLPSSQQQQLHLHLYLLSSLQQLLLLQQHL